MRQLVPNKGVIGNMAMGSVFQTGLKSHRNYSTPSQIYSHWNWNSKLNTKLGLEFQIEYRFKLEFQVE